MSRELEHNELIHHYLNGQLTGDAKADFEQMMESDWAFKAKVKEAFVLDQMVVEKRMHGANAVLSDIMATRPVPKKSNGKWWIGGLFVVALLGTGLWWFSSNTEADTETKEYVADGRNDVISNSKGEPSSNSGQSEKGDNVVPAHGTDKDDDVKEVSEPEMFLPNEIKELDDFRNDEGTTGENEMTFEEVEAIANNNEIMSSKKSDVVEIAEPDPCQRVIWDITPKVINTCPDKNEGEISFETNGMYKYSMDGSQFTSFTKWKGLSPGKYEVEVRHPNGCEITVGPIGVLEKLCTEASKGNDYEFYLSSPEPLQFDEYDGSEGVLAIWSSTGQKIYEVEFGQEISLSWFNSQAKPGYYKYAFSYKDGRVLEGGITVID